MDRDGGLPIVGDSAVDGVACHVMLKDLRLPGTDGLEATMRIRAAAPDTAVLLVTMLDDEETRIRGDARRLTVTSSRAVGSMGSSKPFGGLVAGEAIFVPGVPARMLQNFTDGDDARPFADLSGRERPRTGLGRRG